GSPCPAPPPATAHGRPPTSMSPGCPVLSLPCSSGAPAAEAMPGPIIPAVIVPAQAHAHTRLFIDSFPPLAARFLLPDRLREDRSVNPDTIARRRATPHIRPFDRIRYAIVTGRGGRRP